MEQNRSGDHICYISDLRKMKAHYPGWDIRKSLDEIFQEIYASWANRTMPLKQSKSDSQRPVHDCAWRILI